MTTQRKLTFHVVQHLTPGGIEILAINMTKLASPEHKVLIISLEGQLQQAIDAWPVLAEIQDKLLFLDKGPGVEVKTWRTLYRLFRIMQPDLVHTHHIGPLLYASVAARLAGVKHRIHTEHDAWHLENSKSRWVQGAALSFAKPWLVADAQHVKGVIDDHFGYSRSTVIHNGIDCTRFKPAAKPLARQALGLPTDKRLIGCAGRLENVKGHDVAIRALATLPSHYHLVIAGRGSERESLIALARELGVESRLTLLGLIEDTARFYPCLDVFVQPSRFEGFPLATLEAQACGIATVATDVGGTADTLCPQSSLLIEPDNVTALSEAILALERRTLPHSPRPFVERQFEIREMIKAYQMLTKEACA
ncbi:glycosyltransferase [Vibrio scophthalmi]|uniref:glycosyltransferase n=1 Tax=Vibrio scophthalmi TaxID=45658 RepID=UPI002FF194B8